MYLSARPGGPIPDKMAGVPGIQITPAQPDDADQLRPRREQWADGGDPKALLARPSAQSVLDAVVRRSEGVIVARTADGKVAGFGRLHSWTEEDRTVVHLLEDWTLPGPGRAAAQRALLSGLADLVGDQYATPHSVLAVNGDPADRERTELLHRLGYRFVFEVVELELGAWPGARPMPEKISTRSVRPEDADAITDLTNRVWTGRPHYTPLSYEDGRGWLSRVDPELFLLAEQDGQIVGLVATKINNVVAEIDDVQVAPAWQRRGIASALLTRSLERIRDRTRLPIRLLTGADDAAGARSLYESLGFTPAARHGRYRKPLPTNDSRSGGNNR